jgi:hypothetical protein
MYGLITDATVAVLPVNTNPQLGDYASPNLIIEDWNYGSDSGGDSSGYGDATSYMGDYGNYNNSDDSFDGYSGVDSGTTTASTAPHQDSGTSPNTYYVYSQSSGNVTKFVDGVGTPVGTGYSGDQTYYNNPDAQSIKNEGPIPQGQYDIGKVDNHKGPNTIDLSPADTNTMYSRDNFLIHGDNSGANHTASQGCIILGPSVRQEIINSKITTLIVTR